MGAFFRFNLPIAQFPNLPGSFDRATRGHWPSAQEKQKFSEAFWRT
jgi:hypothetical protein